MMVARKFNNWMLIIVMPNPMQFTSVNAEALFSTGALWAIIVENWGESVITTAPQKSIKANTIHGCIVKNSGDNRQHIPDAARANMATFLFP